MSNTKESIKKMLEEKKQGTKNQGGAQKKADKTLGKTGQTTRNQRQRSSTVNKSV